MVPRAILAVVNRSRPEAHEAVRSLERWAEAHEVECRVLALRERLPVEPDERFLAVSLGGDGTFLRCAGLVAEHRTPVLGINVGSLGFLTQTNSRELVPALDQVLAGDYTIEERMRVEADCGGLQVSALNEIALVRTDVDDFTEIELTWRGELISRYPGDGVIIAAPSGSTAYSLAAAGPVVFPSLECFLVTPLNVHTFGLRPLILPADAQLMAEMRYPGWLLVDGMKIAKLLPEDRIEIRRSPYPTRLVVLGDGPGFFQLLAGKLCWGVGPRRAA
jgi:NAD+ kinase